MLLSEHHLIAHTYQRVGEIPVTTNPPDFQWSYLLARADERPQTDELEEESRVRKQEKI